jgi:hypothetical protein
MLVQEKYTAGRATPRLDARVPGVTGCARPPSGKARVDEQRVVALPQSVRRYLAKEAGAVGEDTCKTANRN